MSVDWSWWRKLEIELEPQEGWGADFMAWEKVMDKRFGGMCWWQDMSSWNRIDLWSVMVDLRKQSREGEA